VLPYSGLSIVGRLAANFEGRGSAHAGLLRALAGLGLLACAPQAWANAECQLAFDRWAKRSGELVRTVRESENPDADARGACVPTEAVRTHLLDGLARAHVLCAEALPSDQTAQHTRTMLGINQSFIASLGVCRSNSAEAGAGWVTKAAPAPEKPRIVAPPPPPPKPVLAAPPPPPPKPVAAAPIPAAPKPATPPPSPRCLEVLHGQDDQYSLVNRGCPGHIVLAVIETRAAGGETACRGYAINQTLAVRAPKATPPRVNHECILSQGPCNQDRLGNMFPECDW
jgi:hypothetical protein